MTAPSSLRVIADMGAFADEVLERIARAGTCVDVECFIVRGDRLGRALAEALAGAAARGVAVRLLYDPVGCRTTPRSYFRELGQRGVAVRRYGHFASLLVGRPGARDHARIVVIDREVAYTGGHAWGDEWAPAARGGQGWHDVCAGAAGPIVADFQEVFDQHWSQAARQSPTVDHDSGVLAGGLRLVCDAPVGHSIVLGAYLDAFERARRRIWMANAYFFPPRVMRHALRRARARGVDVKVILPAISDLPIIQAAARGSYGTWSRDDGLQIWEYQPVVMHAKYALVDDDWALIGTFNANPVSIAAAIEVAVIGTEPGSCAATAAQMEQDLARSRQVAGPTPTMAAPQGVPAWRSRRRHRRLLDWLARLLLLLSDLLLRKQPGSVPPARSARQVVSAGRRPGGSRTPAARR